jgi:hypothetical protein
VTTDRGPGTITAVTHALTTWTLAALLGLAALGCHATGGRASSAACPTLTETVPLPPPEKAAVAPPRAGPHVSDQAASETALSAIEPRPKDPLCEPAVSPTLADVMYRTANKLIEAHGDHVSDGELEVIIPLLRLAAHSGHREAQRRLGFYVVGYYLTDGMFWPHQKEIAADALAMLHVVAVDAPDVVGEEAGWVVPYRDPTSRKTPFPAAWVKRSKQMEAHYRKCHAARVSAPSSQIGDDPHGTLAQRGANR